MCRLRYPLPLVLIAALAVRSGPRHQDAAHRLENKVHQTALARVADPSTPWIHHGIEASFVTEGSRRHRHRGGCVVRFDRFEGHS